MSYELRIQELESKLNQQHEAMKVLFGNVLQNSALFDVALLDEEVEWKIHAINQAIAGKSKVFIAKHVGKTRQTVSTYLNKPKIKLAIEAQKGAR